MPGICRNWSTESLIQTFPGCIIIEDFLLAPVTKCECNSICGPPLFNIRTRNLRQYYKRQTGHLPQPLSHRFTALLYRWVVRCSWHGIPVVIISFTMQSLPKCKVIVCVLLSFLNTLSIVDGIGNRWLIDYCKPGQGPEVSGWSHSLPVTCLSHSLYLYVDVQ